MSGLPAGWQRAALFEVCERIVDGSHNPPKAASDGYPMLSAKNIQQRMISFDDHRLISAADFSTEHRRTAISPGDVLLTIVGAIGRTAVVDAGLPVFTLQRSVAVLRSANLVPRYLSYALESPLVQKALSENAKGTAQKGVYLKTLGSMSIPLAPLPEQKRIADKLDSVLARVEACRDRLDRIPALLKRFRQSVLAAAMHGQLTGDWRETLERDCEGWDEAPLGQLIVEMRNGLSPKPSEQPPGVKILRISAVRPGKIALADHRYLEVDQATRQLCALRQGDLLFTRYNGTLEFVGVCARVPADLPDYVYPDKLIRVRVNKERVSPQFVELAFGCDSARSQVEEFVKSSAGQKGIAGGDLKSVKLPVPPLDEQHEIVRRVETLFAFADRLEARCAAARKQAGQLTPALLAKAFRGELVPQDPADEPAAELLKRLAARRAEAPKVRRGRKPVRTAE